MFKKIVVALIVMIGSVTTYPMDNVPPIQDYYKQSVQSALAIEMRLLGMYLHEKGQKRHAQWLAEQQLLWHKSNKLSVKTNKKK